MEREVAQAVQMKGKTIEDVEVGFRKDIKGVHGSEVLIIHFADGSIMSLGTGSNVADLVSGESGLRPEDLHVRFEVVWVPPFPGGMQKTLP